MHQLFPRPVTVLVGLGFPRELRTVAQAIEFLDETAPLARDEAFQATRMACIEALRGEIPASEAYDILCALTRRRGVFVEHGMVEPAIAAATRIAA